MYLMKEVCGRIGMTYDTLKYYCNQGLVPDVKRDAQNRRIFDDSQVEWISNLKCLKKCGMTIHEMKKYVDLCMLGNETIPERRKMLDIKKQNLLQQKKELEESIDFIEYKMAYYDSANK